MPPKPQPPRPARRRGAMPMRGEPRVRRGTVRVPADVATRIRSGHPYLFRDALGGRPLQQSAGDLVELVDPAGEFVAKGIFDPTGAIAVRVVSRNPEGVFDAETIARRVRGGPAPARAGAARRRLGHLSRDPLRGRRHPRRHRRPLRRLSGRAPVLVGDGAVAVRALRRARKDVEAARHLRAAALPSADGRGAARAGDAGARRGRARRARGQRGRRQVRRRRHGAARHRAVPRSARRAPGGRRSWRRGGACSTCFRTPAPSRCTRRRRGRARWCRSTWRPRRTRGRGATCRSTALDEARHEFIAGDTFKVLAKMAERQRQFDLVVLDPPSFGQSKERGVFSVQKDYRELVEGCLAVAAPGVADGGVLEHAQDFGRGDRPRHRRRGGARASAGARGRAARVAAGFPGAGGLPRRELPQVLPLRRRLAPRRTPRRPSTAA